MTEFHLSNFLLQKGLSNTLIFQKYLVHKQQNSVLLITLLSTFFFFTFN